MYSFEQYETWSVVLSVGIMGSSLFRQYDTEQKAHLCQAGCLLVTAQEINVNIAFFWITQLFCYNKDHTGTFILQKISSFQLGLVAFSKGRPAASSRVP